MLLHVIPLYESVTIDVGDDVEHVVFDRRYPLLDGEGHDVILKRVGDTIVVMIKKGKKIVQHGSVPFLSSAAGTNMDGIMQFQSFSIELDPKRPIFPVRQLVKTMLEMGIQPQQITPMSSEDGLSDCIPVRSSPMVLSDGEVDRLDLPADRGIEAVTLFTVRDASWAVSAVKGELVHIYIWMDAAEPENTAALLEKLQQIQAGELMSV